MHSTMKVNVAILLLGLICFSNALPRPDHNIQHTQQQKLEARQQQLFQPNRQVVYLKEETRPSAQEKQQEQYPVAPEYPRELTYLSLLEPQFQVPGFNILQDKQAYPRVQPQILLYNPNGQGQAFLLQPGGAPPTNFLVPQPGPNIIIRGSPQPQPQRPVFVAGYPKPAHIPPIEKDAEEVPTDASKIPATVEQKPEKLETFNEEQAPKRSAGEVDGLNEVDFNKKTNLKPGQRFFILNGQRLFTNYNFQPAYNEPNINFKYLQPNFNYQPEFVAQKPAQENFENYLLRNAVTGQISDVELENQKNDNAGALNNQQRQESEVYFRSSVPLNIATTKDNYIPPFNPDNNQAYFQFQPSEDYENDAIIVESSAQDEPAEQESGSSPKVQTSVSQAQPGAIALAGPGGVAGAAPRGTAIVGKGGLAVSSPTATAVAGPKRPEAEPSSTNKKETKKSSLV